MSILTTWRGRLLHGRLCEHQSLAAGLLMISKYPCSLKGTTHHHTVGPRISHRGELQVGHFEQRWISSSHAAVVPLWRNKSFVAWRGRLLAPCIWHLSCPLQADVGKLLIWLRNIWNFAILKGNKNIVGSPMFKEKNCYHIQKGQFYSCKMPVIPIFDYDYDTPFQISQKWYVPKFVMFFFRFFISQFCM